MMTAISAAISGRIRAAPSGGGTPTQGLTHSLDVTKEGMDVKSTRTCSEAGCAGEHVARGYCLRHYAAAKRKGLPPLAEVTFEDRIREFWNKVDKTDTCWLWMGRPTAYGYGTITINYRSWRAHRLSYELTVGPIPDGLVIDHLCRNRLCVRPDHLEAVTNRENVLRGHSPIAVRARSEECVNGHPFDEENTRTTSVQRVCRECARLTNMRYRAKKGPDTTKVECSRCGLMVHRASLKRHMLNGCPQGRGRKGIFA